MSALPRLKQGKFVYLNRTFTNVNQQLGIMTVIDDNGHIVFSCNTLELPDRNNARKHSQIPRGTYQCFKTYHEKFKGSVHVMGVAGRDGIMIHSGNFHFQIEGCILVGSNYQHLNKDNEIDIASSRDTLNQLLVSLDETFFLIIN